jgi:light-regulated signal transduction histidine kinase (bacteriophytochrome)
MPVRGYAPQDRERDFEAFERGVGSGTRGGIGSFLVVRFAALHGGRAWVEDGPGCGASFRVELRTGGAVLTNRRRHRSHHGGGRRHVPEGATTTPTAA